MSLLRKKLEARAAGVIEPPPSIPAGAGFLAAAIALFNGRIVDEPTERLIDNETLVEWEQTAERLKKAPPIKRSRIRDPRTKDRLKSYTYSDPSD
jgi:hypothetical protein